MTTAQLDEFKQSILENTNGEKVAEFFKYVTKLERLKEETDQYREIVNDEFSSFGEKKIAFEKLEEAFLEYDLFLGNSNYLPH